MASFRVASWLIRACSTSAKSETTKLVKAPIQVYGQEGRYAHALYSAAHKENALDKMEGDLKTVQTLFKDNPDLKGFLMNPSVQRTDKTEVVKAVLEKSSISHLVKNLFIVMAENGALPKTNNIIAAFTKIMCAKRGEVVVVVTTAKELSSSQMSSLQDALRGFVKEGEVIKLSTSVNPALVGGMTVSIGDRFIDMSIASKITTYKNLIKQDL